MTVGELAKKARVNVETLRYYERRSILPKPTRTTSGYRIYGEEDVRRIRFVKQAQAMGFRLNEISELMSLAVDDPLTCDEVREQAESKLTEIDRKLSDLRRVRKTLVRLIKSCQTGDPTGPCPILSSLKEDEPERIAS